VWLCKLYTFTFLKTSTEQPLQYYTQQLLFIQVFSIHIKQIKNKTLTLPFIAENCSNKCRNPAVDKPGFNFCSKSKKQKTSVSNKYWAHLPCQNPFKSRQASHSAHDVFASSCSYQPVYVYVSMDAKYFS